MNQDVWNRLICLESHDVVKKWFNVIHSREINTRRTNEINSAAKQAREFFRNASQSDYSVRPLLTFYGVSCLTKALTLLMKSQGGEETLKGAHGLETVDWGKVMSGETSTGLKNITDLKVRSTKGLFLDFISSTENLICIHINSGGVDWRLPYDVPKAGNELTVLDLLSRVPDLQESLSEVISEINFAAMKDCTYSEQNGFSAFLHEHIQQFSDAYVNVGYSINRSDSWIKLSCDSETFSKNLPQIVHTYIHKMFGSIPRSYIARPFPDEARYSQLGITFMLAYVLGMLVRYYPTHWISLIQGGRGDGIWPTFNKAQQLVECSYPELVAEFVRDAIKQSQDNSA